MTPLTLQDVLAHQSSVPWPEIHQVEQDLLLSLSMRAIFDDPFLSGQVTMRGGTVLHKLHLAPPSRYSEDIDLVVVGDRPGGHIRKALMRVLRPVLGKEKSSAWATVLRTAKRNVAVDDVVSAFQHYMRDEHTKVPRAEFVAHLRSCMEDRAGFCTDMTPLLRKGVDYDPQKSG